MIGRVHALWLAHILHRVSGIGLALFLPVHFWVLSLALTRPDQLDRFLAFTDRPVVKVMEVLLVFLLAIHAFGGLRLLVLEWLPWSASQKSLAAAACGGAMALSGLFLFQVI
jgi:fumarate reductase subunit D